MRTTLPLLVCLLLVAGCQKKQPAETPAEAPSDTAAATEAPAATDSIPNRAAETDRDAGSHPQEVMDFVGIGPGDTVADIFAGGGYYTYLLSQRVGADGKVYAQGFRPGLKARVERGDLTDATNVALVDSMSQIPDAALDHAIIIRGYHLFPDPDAFLAQLSRSLKSGGTVGVVEVRLGKPRGHDMETHRMGEQTVIDQFEAGGFKYDGSSDVLRNPEDDHTGFWEGRRAFSDRMLLKFSKP